MSTTEALLSKITQDDEVIEGQLSLQFGTINPKAIKTRMPPSHQKWDDIAKKLPTLVSQYRVRDVIAELPILSAEIEHLAAEYLPRASLILNSLAHAYYYHNQAVPLARRAQDDPLPDCIEKPWQTVTVRLKRNVKAPSRTIFDSVLHNWKLRDEAKPFDPASVTLDDLEVLVPILGTKEERIFFLTIAIMEMRFAPAITALMKAHHAIESNQPALLGQQIDVIIATLKNVIAQFRVIQTNSYSKTYVDPVVWAKSIIPIEDSTRPDELPGNGASTPLFHIMDAFLSVLPNPHMVAYAKIFPTTLQNYLAVLSREELSVINYVKEKGSPELKLKLIDLLNTYEELLVGHFIKAYGFIHISFDVGREQTTGFLHKRLKIVEFLSAAIQARRKEIQAELPPAYVVANNKLSKDVHEIVMAIPFTHGKFKVGEKCEVYPENSASVVRKWLEEKGLSGDEEFELNAKWKEFLVRNNIVTSETVTGKIKLSQILYHADLSGQTIQVDLETKDSPGDKPGIPERFQTEERRTRGRAAEHIPSYVSSESSVEQSSHLKEGVYFEQLQPLQPRYYSVAPVVTTDKDEFRQLVRLTIKQFDKSIIDPRKKGVASTYLCASHVGQTIILRKASGYAFQLPADPTVPIIMFSCGTGIAPFIGMLEERIMVQKANRNFLFCSLADTRNVYYSGQLQRYSAERNLQAEFIFSQENAEIKFDSERSQWQVSSVADSKGYMSKLIKQNAQRILELLLRDHAMIYVCGHSYFTHDVYAAFIEILLPAYNYNREKTVSYLNSLIINESFQQEIFTRRIKHEAREISLTEVAQHNTHSLWTVINDSVYDLTPFISQHPGGERIMQAVAGIDGSEVYQMVNHEKSQQIISRLEHYRVGKLAKPMIADELSNIYAFLGKMLNQIVRLENLVNFGFKLEHNPHKLSLVIDLFDVFVKRLFDHFELFKKGVADLKSHDVTNEIGHFLHHLLNARILLQSKTSSITIVQDRISHALYNDPFKIMLFLQMYQILCDTASRFLDQYKKVLTREIQQIEKSSFNTSDQLVLLAHELEQSVKQFIITTSNLLTIKQQAIQNLMLPALDRSSHLEVRQQKVIVVGGGLAGIVLAAFLAKEGLAVVVYDNLPDPRTVNLAGGRSINITLCERGLKPLEAIGARKFIESFCVRAVGRAIHQQEGSLILQDYGNNVESLYSVNRHSLAQALVEFVSTNYNVKFNFNQKCTTVDLASQTITFEHTETRVPQTVQADAIVGADGANSKIRTTIVARHPEIQLTEVIHSHAYKEVLLPASKKPESLVSSRLHIWPRGEIMLIGFPNTDGSMTLSLHIPYENNIAMQTRMQTLAGYHSLFAELFPDIYPLIKDELLTSYLHPLGRLRTVRCSSWIDGDEGKVTLVGDAAHAIYPFYGQGANFAFEDCQVLAQCYRDNPTNWGKVFSSYQQLRKANADTIADLAEEHLKVLNTKIADQKYLDSQKLALELQKQCPLFNTLYHNICFTSMPYHVARDYEECFHEVLKKLLAIENILELVKTPEWKRTCRDCIVSVMQATIQSKIRLPATKLFCIEVLRFYKASQFTEVSEEKLCDRPHTAPSSVKHYRQVLHSKNAGDLLFFSQPNHPLRLSRTRAPTVVADEVVVKARL